MRNNNMLSLYDRQQNLQLKTYSSLIVVGVGGIGNWVALNAALTGLFSNIILIDGDVVESSNLNRTIFEISDIGEFKCDAVRYQILKRRPDAIVTCINKITSPEVIKQLIDDVIEDNSYYHTDIVCVDCRDDIYEDLYPLNCKLYKVGYDGMSMTIDGNPRLTKVFTQRGGSYSITPSFVGSSQLVACLVINDIVYPPLHQMAQNNQKLVNSIPIINESIQNDCEDNVYVTDKEYAFKNDECGRLNGPLTFNACDILYALHPTREKFSIEECLRYVLNEETYEIVMNSIKGNS